MFRLLLAVTLAVSVLTTSTPSSAQSHPLHGFFETAEHFDFWVANGWVYQSGTKDAPGQLNIEQLQPLNGQAALTAETFSQNTFNPQMYTIRPLADQPLVYRVGDKGTLLFLPLNRVEVLYQRELINRQAAQKQQQ